MAPKKKLMRAMLFSCFTSKNHHPLDYSKKKRVSNQHSSSSSSSVQRLSLSDISDPGSQLSATDLSKSLIGSNLHIFTLAELKVITHDFSTTNFLGEGGFGPVYKGFVDDRTRSGLKAQPVAVKLLDLDGTQGYREWLTEVIFLGQLKHPHLVKLIGYCCEDEHRLLVYEYMARGNLENQLFRRYSISLPWLTRIRIAVGAARGLAFLHGEDKPVIYRDFKTSNILLDSDYNAKLSDFGLAKDGPQGDDTHVTTRVMGTHGYAAPEYIMTGHLTTMSDVYSFGVVLLELLTGKRALDKSRPSREQNLVEWARPILRDIHKLDKIIMDSKLDGQYSLEGAKKAALLACQCLSHQAKSRPTMDRVVKVLENILDLKKDIPVGPFVYIVPKEGKRRDEHQYHQDDVNLKTRGHVKNEEEEKEKDKEDDKYNRAADLKKKGNQHQQQGCRNGHRHRIRSPALYTDTALYPNLRKQFKLPEAREFKIVNTIQTCQSKCT